MYQKRWYHVNPHTGVPSKCFAKYEMKCRYGGTSGMSNHYRTYTEAQAYAKEMMKDQYRMLPSQVAEYGYELDKVDEMLQEKLHRDSPEIQEFLNMNKNEQAKIIRKTANYKLLMGIIHGDIGDRDWKVIGPALQNENVPDELLYDMLIQYQDEWSVETRRWAITNKSLPAGALRRAFVNEYEDGVITLLFANGNIEKNYLEYLVHDKEVELLTKLPYAMIFMDKRNEGVPWIDYHRKKVEVHHRYEESVERARELIAYHRLDIDIEGTRE